MCGRMCACVHSTHTGWRGWRMQLRSRMHRCEPFFFCRYPLRTNYVRFIASLRKHWYPEYTSAMQAEWKIYKCKSVQLFMVEWTDGRMAASSLWLHAFQFIIIIFIASFISRQSQIAHERSSLTLRTSEYSKFDSTNRYDSSRHANPQSKEKWIKTIRLQS